MTLIKQRNLIVLNPTHCYLADYDPFSINGQTKPIPTRWGGKRHTVWIEEFVALSSFWLDKHSIKFLMKDKVKTLAYKKGRIL